MTKVYREADLSAEFEQDFTWRIFEISSLKDAILDAAPKQQAVLLRALVAILYAHWEGHIKFIVEKYFQFITIRKISLHLLERQLHINHFIPRLAAIASSGAGVKQRSALLEDILFGGDYRFARIDKKLIDTRSNLNSQVLEELCLVCGLDYSLLFKDHDDFIDRIVLKRRNEIAHGQDTPVGSEEIDTLVDNVLALMRSFRNGLENKIYNKEYLKAEGSVAGG
ncbi:MAE_28990/MAE_18760 family HEPN-like nuclease [Roseomonas chloroacetimidivorans]|uniref:MAE_28990/MAE_18760 family HEPN-like nuclease n=1 Tax=Roseomonas chloroacetimidivorans TaxID=1766656 RepID=UPI003C75566A